LESPRIRAHAATSAATGGRCGEESKLLWLGATPIFDGSPAARHCGTNGFSISPSSCDPSLRFALAPDRWPSDEQSRFRSHPARCNKGSNPLRCRVLAKPPSSCDPSLRPALAPDRWPSDEQSRFRSHPARCNKGSNPLRCDGVVEICSTGRRLRELLAGPSLTFESVLEAWSNASVEFDGCSTPSAATATEMTTSGWQCPWPVIGETPAWSWEEPAAEPVGAGVRESPEPTKLVGMPRLAGGDLSQRRKKQSSDFGPGHDILRGCSGPTVTHDISRGCSGPTVTNVSEAVLSTVPQSAWPCCVASRTACNVSSRLARSACTL